MSVSLVKRTGRHRDPAEVRQPDLYYPTRGERTYLWMVGPTVEPVIVPIAHCSTGSRHAA